MSQTGSWSVTRMRETKGVGQNNKFIVNYSLKGNNDSEYL